MINKALDFSDKLEVFRSREIMTIEQLSTLLGISSRNTHNHLKKWGVITSYNQNGRYYALPDIPKFDSHGLWSIDEIHFSKHGNLRKTVVHLVDSSEMGLDGKAIGKLMKLNPRSFLSHFGKLSEFHRKKIGGRFVYFSGQTDRFNNQLKKRMEYREIRITNFLPDTIGIRVLVEKINHPNLRVEQLAKRLQKQAVAVTSKQIKEFFVFHGLVKKTPDSVWL